MLFDRFSLISNKLPQDELPVSLKTKKLFYCPCCKICSDVKKEVTDHFKTHTCYTCPKKEIDKTYHYVMEGCSHILCCSCIFKVKEKYDGEKYCGKVPSYCNRCKKEDEMEFTTKYFWDPQCSFPLWKKEKTEK